MSYRCQLPCPTCQNSLVVSPAQAGEVVICGCGTEVTVPTLRELRQFAVADLPSPGNVPSSNTWSIERGLLFVGGLLIVALAVLAHIRISPQRQALMTRPPQFQELPFDVQLLTPSEAWQAWQNFRTEKLEARNTPSFITNRQQHQQLSYSLYIAWAAAALGAILVGVASWPRKRQSPKASRLR